MDERRLLEVGLGRSSLPRKKSNSWEQCISIFGEPLTGAPFPRKYNSISSSFCQSRGSSCQSRSRHRLRTSTPSAFPDKTSLSLSKPKLEKGFVSGNPNLLLLMHHLIIYIQHLIYCLAWIGFNFSPSGP